jgi:hypothetical protein
MTDPPPPEPEPEPEPVPPTHACPGCGERGIAHDRLSCHDCWSRLPLDIRWRLNGTRDIDLVGYRIALDHALNFYHETRHMVQQRGDLNDTPTTA